MLPERKCIHSNGIPQPHKVQDYLMTSLTQDKISLLGFCLALPSPDYCMVHESTQSCPACIDRKDEGDKKQTSPRTLDRLENILKQTESPNVDTEDFWGMLCRFRPGGHAAKDENTGKKATKLNILTNWFINQWIHCTQGRIGKSVTKLVWSSITLESDKRDSFGQPGFWQISFSVSSLFPEKKPSPVVLSFWGNVIAWILTSNKKNLGSLKSVSSFVYLFLFCSLVKPLDMVHSSKPWSHQPHLLPVGVPIFPQWLRWSQRFKNVSQHRVYIHSAATIDIVLINFPRVRARLAVYSPLRLYPTSWAPRTLQLTLQEQCLTGIALQKANPSAVTRSQTTPAMDKARSAMKNIATFWIKFKQHWVVVLTGTWHRNPPGHWDNNL